MDKKPTHEELEQRVKELEKEAFERKRAERALGESEKKYRDFAEGLSALVYRADPKTFAARYVNKAVERLYGYTVQEWLDDPSLWEKSIHPDDREKVLSELVEAQGKMENIILEYRSIRKDKAIRWMEDHISFEKDAQGNAVSVNGVMYDMTERKQTEKELRQYRQHLEELVEERTFKLTKANKDLELEIIERQRAEEALRESEDRYRRITEAITDYIYTVTIEDGRPVKTIHGPACVAVTGYMPEDFRVNPYLWVQMVHEEDRVIVREQAERILSGQDVQPIEHRIFRKDGSMRWVRNTLVPYYDPAGTLLSYDGLVRDIHARKRVEEAIQRSSEEIKLFAYSVSHDLKSPAIGIYGLTKRLCKHYGDGLDEKAKIYCDQVLKAAEQIAALVEMINVYISSKETPLNIEKVKLKKISEMVRDEFSTQLNILQIRWSQPETMPEIKADRLSILRILRNLVDNALKYGGEDLSEIGLGYRESDEFHILSVSDDGVAIKQEDFERIFGPFQRHETASGIEGAGLGLAIVKTLAARHGGKVWMESRREKGTSFYVSISRSL